MINFNFDNYTKGYMVKYNINKYDINKMNEYLNDIYCLDINNSIKKKDIEKINKIKEKVLNNSSVFLVIGIGGSYMGSKSIIEALLPYFYKKKIEIIYAGNNLSQEYIECLINYIKNKDITVNVISKSGNTLEILETYKIIKKFMENKYTNYELRDRIIITTANNNGKLKKIALKEKYELLLFDDKIGGRFSIMTIANLLPMAIAGINILKLINGYKNGIKYKNEIFKYAIMRNMFYKKQRYIESFCVYEPKLYYFTEWLKQLISETEGKNNKGILPISTVNTRDLHSLGQFLQEGNNIVFETVIRINKKKNKLDKLNYSISEKVALSHFMEHTPSIIIEISRLDEKSIGELVFFFIASSILSAFLLGVNPYTQDGVEKYKKLI